MNAKGIGSTTSSEDLLTTPPVKPWSGIFREREKKGGREQWTLTSSESGCDGEKQRGLLRTEMAGEALWIPYTPPGKKRIKQVSIRQN